MELELSDGRTERLTYWGSASTTVLGWTADHRVLVASSAGEANPRHAMVKAVGLDGRIERLPWGLVSAVALHPGGPLVTSTPGDRPPAWWKRNRLEALAQPDRARLSVRAAAARREGGAGVPGLDTHRPGLRQRPGGDLPRPCRRPSQPVGTGFSDRWRASAHHYPRRRAGLRPRPHRGRQPDHLSRPRHGLPAAVLGHRAEPLAITVSAAVPGRRRRLLDPPSTSPRFNPTTAATPAWCSGGVRRST